jgi:hypothetical protein
LYQLYKKPNIVKMAKAAMLRWLGHLYRCEESNPCKKLTFTQPDRVRKKGRPPARWMDAVVQDLCTLGSRGWKNIALDRSR